MNDYIFIPLPPSMDRPSEMVYFSLKPRTLNVLPQTNAKLPVCAVNRCMHEASEDETC